MQRWLGYPPLLLSGEDTDARNLLSAMERPDPHGSCRKNSAGACKVHAPYLQLYIHSEEGIVEFREYIKSCKCQVCEYYGSCAVMKDPIHGTLELCKTCDPHAYERVAESQKQKWVTTGKI